MLASEIECIVINAFNGIVVLNKDDEIVGWYRQDNQKTTFNKNRIKDDRGYKYRVDVDITVLSHDNKKEDTKAIFVYESEESLNSDMMPEHPDRVFIYDDYQIIHKEDWMKLGYSEEEAIRLEILGKMWK